MNRILALLLGIFFVALPARAVNDAPNVVNYQGKLLNSSGANVSDGTYTVQFKLYGAATGTTFLWGASYTVVVSAGYFNVMLGEGGSAISGATYTAVSDALGATSTPYLGVTITADSNGSISNPSEITPRLRFLSSPYALIAAKSKYADTAASATNAQTLNGLDTSKFLQPQNTTATTINGPLTMASTVTISQTLTVNAASTVNGSLTVNGALSATSTTGGGFVPVGGIIMWSGTTAPDGWALCNGSGTYTLNGQSVQIPDLQDRFVIGAGRNYASKATGGATSVTLGANNIPDHRHQFKDTVFSENQSYSGNNGPDGLGSGYDYGYYVGSKSGSDYDNNLLWVKRYTDYARGGTSSVDAFSVTPPYYALAYIIRTR